MLAKMVEPFTKALDMLEVEKSAILGKKSSLFFFLEAHLTSNGLLRQPQCALCLLFVTWHHRDHLFVQTCMCGAPTASLGTSALPLSSWHVEKVFRQFLPTATPAPHYSSR